MDSVEPQRWLITEGLRMFRKCFAGGSERPPCRARGPRACGVGVARGRGGEGRGGEAGRVADVESYMDLSGAVYQIRLISLIRDLRLARSRSRLFEVG